MTDPITTDPLLGPRWIRWILIAAAVAIMTLLVVLPLALVSVLGLAVIRSPKVGMSMQIVT